VVNGFHYLSCKSEGRHFFRCAVSSVYRPR